MNYESMYKQLYNLHRTHKKINYSLLGIATEQLNLCNVELSWYGIMNAYYYNNTLGTVYDF